MKKPLCAVLVSIVVAGFPVFAKPPHPPAAARTVTVMTQNVYAGVDDLLAAVPAATSFEQLAAAVAAIYNGYFMRNFPERAAALAREIEVHQPDLIALQEAILVRTQTPPDGPATPATTVEIDYVEILLDALAARGLHYEVVVQSINFDAELPSAFGFDVRHTDREVILARSDLKVSELKLSNAQGGNFTASCVVPTSLGPIDYKRGWVSVDVKVRGKQMRLVSTHLDATCLPITDLVQQAQALELLQGPSATNLPVVLVGDLNSAAGSGASYNLLRSAGFQDAALDAGAASPTCCQAADLSNPASMLDTRIDFILYRGPVAALAADVIGDDESDMTPFGLWPSDHAGVVAVMHIAPH